MLPAHDSSRRSALKTLAFEAVDLLHEPLKSLVLLSMRVVSARRAPPRLVSCAHVEAAVPLDFNVAEPLASGAKSPRNASASAVASAYGRLIECLTLHGRQGGDAHTSIISDLAQVRT